MNILIFGPDGSGKGILIPIRFIINQPFDITNK